MGADVKEIVIPDTEQGQDHGDIVAEFGAAEVQIYCVRPRLEAPEIVCAMLMALLMPTQDQME